MRIRGATSQAASIRFFRRWIQRLAHVRVRMVFRNPGVVLKPGMYVNVKIGVPMGRQLVVPASAVLQSGERAIAFVDHGQGYLEPRTIQTGPQVDDSIVVLSGLKAGEQVVSSANFLVDSEAQLQAALAGFAPPPLLAQPNAGANNTPAAQVQIDLSTAALAAAKRRQHSARQAHRP